MRTLEYQGKDVFKSFGLSIPRGSSARNPLDARRAAEEIGGQVMVKAQVLIGGRGKAGGIKEAHGSAEAEALAAEILGMSIKGYPVREVYVEEKLDIKHEFYLGITLDRLTGVPVMIISSKGGVDIETVAREEPEKVERLPLDPLWGLHPYQIRHLCASVGIDSRYERDIISTAVRLFELFMRTDATLVEINPLAVLADGAVVCADSKLVVDDSALFRHPEFAAFANEQYMDPLEKETNEKGISFVRLDGNIAVIGNGAGLVMSTLDSLALEGGSAANFMDIGGGAMSARVRAALQIVFKIPGVKVVFINIFGGITRCDEVARGIVDTVKETKTAIPMVVRLVGTNEEEGRRILKQSGLNMMVFEVMRTATVHAVRLAGRADHEYSN